MTIPAFDKELTVPTPDGRTLRVQVRQFDRHDKGTKSRAYVSRRSADEASPEDVLGPFAQLVGAPSVWTRRGEFPALDKAWDAFNSRVVDLKTEDLKTGLLALGCAPAVLAGAKFSRKAGCSCGCSPGFVVPGLPSRLNVWIGEETPAPAAERAFESEEESGPVNSLPVEAVAQKVVASAELDQA